MARPIISWAGLAALTLILTGCGTQDEDGVGGVSASEARALNEAAEMLDSRTGSQSAPPSRQAGNQSVTGPH